MNVDRSPTISERTYTRDLPQSEDHPATSGLSTDLSVMVVMLYQYACTELKGFIIKLQNHPVTATCSLRRIIMMDQ